MSTRLIAIELLLMDISPVLSLYPLDRPNYWAPLS